MDYQVMLDYVTKVLEESGNNRSKNPLHSFRNRASHIERVFKWGKILLADFDEIDEAVALTACIFHDVGYAKQKENHALISSEMFKDYALQNSFDQEFTDKVSEIISLHSNKELLKSLDASNELKLLLEADLLDEEGALGIVWDLMAFGAKHPDSYYDTVDVLSVHSAHILNQDYMVTPIAKSYWNDKKQFVKKFIEEIKTDLFLKEDEI